MPYLRQIEFPITESERTMGKQALCIPARVLREVGEFQGFMWGAEAAKPYIDRLTNTDNWCFRDRDECETNEAFKQIIPYTVVSAGADPLRVLRYYRTSVAGEQRLRGKASVGIGGHVEPEDVAAPVAEYVPRSMAGLWQLTGACLRELYEEVLLPPYLGARGLPSIVGVINDDSDAVGRVHVGLVFLAAVAPGAVHARDAELADPQFVLPSMLRVDVEAFEAWSQIVIREYIAR